LLPPPSSILLPYTTLFRSSFDDFLAVMGIESVDVTHIIFLTVRPGDGHNVHPALFPLHELVCQRLGFLVGTVVGLFNTHRLPELDRKSTRLNSSHVSISYA